MYLHTARNVKVGGFWFRGSVNPYEVSVPPEFAPLSFTLGYGVKKNHTQNNTHQITKMLLSSKWNRQKPQSLGSISTWNYLFSNIPWLFTLTKKLANFGKPHLSSTFVAGHEDMKESTCFCFRYESFPAMYTWSSKSGGRGWIHALE